MLVAPTIAGDGGGTPLYDWFDQWTAALERTCDGTEVRGLVSQYVQQALALQAEVDQRRRLAKTLSRMARRLRARGWAELACDTLETAVRHGAYDEYVFTEIAECWLSRGDVSMAERTLGRARAAGMIGAAIYPSLIRAYGDRTAIQEAERVFVSAVRSGAETAFAYSALAGAYAKVGDSTGARRAFDAARSRGFLSCSVFAALASALAAAGEVDQLDGITRAAAQARCASGRLTLIVIRAHLRQGRLDRAKATLRTAVREGTVDASCYSAVVAGCHRVGHHHEARRFLQCAARDCRISDEERWRLAAVQRSWSARRFPGVRRRSMRS